VTPVRRVLFVDDDLPVLRALERMLRVHRAEWECHFEDDVVRALALVDQVHPDAIVSDMLMPGMDGADLLAEAGRRRPRMVRFILSGEIGAEALVRMAGAAHQCLAKPCRGDVLMQVLDQALVSPAADGGPAWLDGLYGLQRLPVAAPPFQALRRLIGQPESDARDARAIALIEGSAGLATKILQVATWTRLGLGAPPVHVRDAYFQLGPEAICALLDSALLKPLPGGETTPLQRQTWRRGERVTAAAAALARAEGFTADDVGQITLMALWSTAAPLLIDCIAGDAYAALRDAAARDGDRLADLEREAFGLTASEAFARLLQLWGLPAAPIAWAARAHDVSALATDRLGPESVAHVACAIVDGLDGHGVAADTRDYLARLGCLPRLDGWQTLASRAVEAVAA
jgi:CheY-like chemotaxis protein/HD-like signal output (HDOD) protein